MTRPLVPVLVAVSLLGSGVAEETEARDSTTDRGGPGAQCREGQSSVVFVNVRVVPMDREVVLDGQTVLVCGDRIREVGPDGSVAVPDDAVVVEGWGQYLLPGLVDTHVHFFEDTWPTFEESRTAYVDHGVTTVVNLWGRGNSPYYLEIRDRSMSRSWVAPTVYTSGEALKLQRFATPDEVEAEVVRQVQAGYDLIKVYEPNSTEVLERIYDTARLLGARTIGHVTDEVGYEFAVENGQGIAHLHEVAPEGLRTGDLEAEAVARGIVAAGVPVQTTLVLGMPRRKRKSLVPAFQREGVLLLLGTDTGEAGIQPGSAVHEELDLLFDSGLTPYQALRTATANPGAYLSDSDRFGTIAPGRRADLLLLPGNPLDDLGVLRRLVGVLLRGTWLPTE